MHLSKLLWMSATAGVLLLSLAGCAARAGTTTPRYQPATDATSTRTSPSALHAGRWIGQYEGEGDVFDRSVRRWVRRQDARLNIYPSGPGALIIQGFR